jgi:hypothetical protein
MPLFGHAFVGLSAALYTKPRSRDSFGAAMWVPILIFLNYLPDIIAQINSLLGLRGTETASHSVVSGVLYSLIIAPVLMVLAKLSFCRAFLISLCSILVHDLLDLLQAPERLFLWPFSPWRPSPEYTMTHMSARDEIIVFGFIYIAALIIYITCFYKHNSQPHHAKTTQQQCIMWFARILLISILMSAGATQYLRKVRVETFNQAKAVLGTTKNYTLGLALIEEAGRWPYGASFAWIDYFKAKAYWGLGDRNKAEQYYHRSLDENPWNFWCVGDVAILYASSNEQLADRRRRVFPYIKLLVENFSGHPSLHGYLKKIEDALGRNQANIENH